MKWNVGRYHPLFDICLCCTPILNVRGQPPEHVSILWSPNWSTRLANDYQQCLGCIGPLSMFCLWLIMGWSLELLFVYVCVCVVFVVCTFSSIFCVCLWLITCAQMSPDPGMWSSPRHWMPPIATAVQATPSTHSAPLHNAALQNDAHQFRMHTMHIALLF